MPEVQLHRIEARLVGTNGRIDKALHDILDAVERPEHEARTNPAPPPARSGLAAAKVLHRLPGAILAQRRAAFPQRLAARLAAGMSQLHADGARLA